MDYTNSQRVKLWGTANVVEDDAELHNQLRDPDYPGEVERAIVFNIEAWDVNCPQHIPQKLDAADVAAALARRNDRIAALEAENAALRTQTGAAR